MQRIPFLFELLTRLVLSELFTFHVLLVRVLLEAHAVEPHGAVEREAEDAVAAFLFAAEAAEHVAVSASLSSPADAAGPRVSGDILAVSAVLIRFFPV